MLLVLAILGCSPTEADFVPGREDGARLGASMASGDIDGDGVVDLLAGAADSDAGAGRVRVFQGRPNGLAARGPSIEGLKGGHGSLGRDLLVADLTDDGQLDVAVTEPWADGGETLHLFAGPIDRNVQPEDAVATVRGLPEYQYDRIAYATGDLNGDGIADLAAAAPEVPASSVFVFLGPLEGDLGPDDADGIITLASSWRYVLSTVPNTSGPGDLLLVGVPERAIVLAFGGPFTRDSTEADALWRLVGESGSWFGGDIRGGVDLDQDRVPDIAVSAALPERVVYVFEAGGAKVLHSSQASAAIELPAGSPEPVLAVFERDQGPQLLIGLPGTAGTSFGAPYSVLLPSTSGPLEEVAERLSVPEQAWAPGAAFAQLDGDLIAIGDPEYGGQFDRRCEDGDECAWQAGQGAVLVTR